jgi:hypothetical protein
MKRARYRTTVLPARPAMASCPRVERQGMAMLSGVGTALLLALAGQR